MSRHIDDILELIDSVLDVGAQHSSERGLPVPDQSATEMLYATPETALRRFPDFFIIDDPVGQPTSQGARAVIWRWYQEYLRGEGDRSDAGRGTQ